ncbi:HlyD family type I secretion periplasmic adaptor subunit [Agrobacterium larrymoorei]|uniref:Membrane fusion protein (MFP) family protein n=1 Tax=Agrobacterium larrymoorei TaxID=160699 RepID=A0AAF0HES4_9HYPH|nr:HlyD family type I secretion periplasmic adaptor subunit [Agrobacterium larrymoorei]WHA43230.1 HlyD family type I secretion periplasmic adaptor subunit [Agrobacterium larrymoorei]
MWLTRKRTVSPTIHVTVFLLLACFVIALTLAFILDIEITARGKGRIVPLTRVQQIQPDTPGKIVAIHVRNGDRVAAGAVLIEFDQTQAAAEVSMLSRELEHLAIEQRRLQTLAQFIQHFNDTNAVDVEAASREFAADRSLHQGQSYFAEQRSLLVAELNELKAKILQQASKREENLKSQAVIKANIEQLEATLPIREQRLKTSEQLRQQGASSGTSYLNYLEEFVTLQKQATVRRTELEEKASELNRISSEQGELLSTTLSSSTQRRAEIESRLLTATEELRVAELNLRNKTLLSPVNGIVDGLNVHTIGGVSDTGDELMRIVPNTAGIELEAVFSNEDIGFLQVGQTAKLNMSAFPAERFGFITGKVTHVSADAIEQADQKWGYTVRISLDKSDLVVTGSTYQLQPGMTASIDVVTGERPLIGYFFAPIIESIQGSMGER